MTALETFYNALEDIRHAFHKYGKLNDANSKLDEITKLLAVELYEIRNGKGNNGILSLISAYEKDNNYDLVRALKDRFTQIAGHDMFKTHNNVPIFGFSPTIEIEEGDHTFAYSLLKLLGNTLEKLKEEERRFDLLNESFGHFVRDNFRNNIEDAQYMTPQEVVDLMSDMALTNIKNKQLKIQKDFTICDPCCGVGSFLATFAHNAQKQGVVKPEKLTVLAQDKVQRMIRLTKLNFSLFKTTNDIVCSGNSLIGPSNLDGYEGKVDLILTNPPFGAKFSALELSKEPKSKYPLMKGLFSNVSSINSEILFIDRCLGLLREGGELLAVVPDSVISSKGVAEKLRHSLINSPNVSLKSVIELPTVTFAQAGTRTKTSILHIKKSGGRKPVFVAKSDDLGFEVSTKKGATVKVTRGQNDLPQITRAFEGNAQKMATYDKYAVLNDSPSCVLVSYENFLNNSWTPNHYGSSMFKVLRSFEEKSKIELIALKEIADFVTKERKKEITPQDAKCISVLHVVNSDILDYEELLKYQPKYPGTTCYPGDLLFSKINPRIPRALVVPDLKFSLTCSSEFEIIQASGSEIDTYGLKILLMLPAVQIQINHLTSGTSSSHNRIKTQDLAKVMLPIPRKHTKAYRKFHELMSEAKKENRLFTSLIINRYRLKEKISNILVGS